VALLIFSKTTGFRHDNIPAAVRALSELGRTAGEEVLVTEDAHCFAPTSLERFSVVVWLNTSGDVLDAEQRVAFEHFVRAGGGYVGVHSASATETSWPFYVELVGARFTGHPEPCAARLVIEDRSHPATRHLGRSWERWDEWYEFDRNPRADSRVLISVDESSYKSGRAEDHPLSWCREVGRGRSFYTALGHRPEDYAEPDFAQHLRGGIAWASGLNSAAPALL
jgi:type 1 glutamine amidotransferase